MAVFADEQGGVSLEELFLMSHRYEVKEMCTKTSAIPLSRLNAANCIPLYFVWLTCSTSCVDR